MFGRHCFHLVACALVLLASCGERTPPGHAEADRLLGHARAATVAIEIVGQDERGPWASHGAGTILHEAGYVLTCEHLTASGERQEVVLSDGRRYPFRVVARAGSSYDLAVLKFEAPPGLPLIALGRSDGVVAGDDVVLLGNPGGRGLRELRAVVDLPDCGGGTQIQLRGAGVVPGYSGGPVLDRLGRQVAHVHVAIRSAEDVSRHIQVDHAREAFRSWAWDETRSPHAAGLRVDCLGDEARVLAVRAGSAAERAGIAPGDVVTRAGALPVQHGIHLVLACLDRRVGEPLALRLRRDDVDREAILRDE
jgi:putative serine protease PepD